MFYRNREDFDVIFQEQNDEGNDILRSNESPRSKELAQTLLNMKANKNGENFHFEYDKDEEYSTDIGYHRFDDHRGWKKARLSYLKSVYKCFMCSFYTTFLCGIPGGLVAVLLTWLHLNLAESCYTFDTHWYQIPLDIRRIRLTTQVVEGMIVQFWSFSALLFVFGWKAVHDLNIPIWNVLAAALDAIYRLFLSVYGIYNKSWHSYPLNVIFASITCFNFYRITAHFERRTFPRIKLAVKFGIAFLLGIPLFLIMNYVLLPAYSKTKSDVTKAVFSSLLPVAFIIPKAIINVCLVDLSEHCEPGRLSVFVVGFYTMTSIIARYLQANVETRAIFIALCFVHAIENVIDKVTYNLRHKCYRYVFGACVGRNDNANNKLAMNRIQADQTLSGMILEMDTILMSCAFVEILNYYYGKDIESNNKHKLLMRFIERISIASIIDLVFNAICIKVQTWYFNIPVMRVWRKKWLWIFAFIITYTCYTVLYCSGYLYGAIITHDAFNSTEVAECLGPFEKPLG